MSGAHIIIVHVEDIFDEINEDREDLTEIRDEALPVRNSSKGHRRDNHVFVVTNMTPALTVVPERCHENFYGWLEQYVDCKLEENKRKAIKSCDDPPTTWNNNLSGHRDVSRPESLTVDRKDEMEQPHRRCISPRVSLHVQCGLEEEERKGQTARNANIETVWEE
jgi:hypothetical protein